MDSLYEKTLAESALFARLSDEQIAVVLEACPPELRDFVRQDTLWNEGDIVDGIGVLVKGTLLCQRFQVDGRVQLLRIFEPPNLINLEAAVSRKRTSPFSVVGAVRGGFLWFYYQQLFDSQVLSEAITRILRENLLRYLADDSIRLMHKTDMLARRTVRGRILLALNLMRQQHHADSFDIGMSREDFARFLCVDRSSLSTELASLRRERLIEFSGQKFHLRYPPNADKEKMREIQG